VGTLKKLDGVHGREKWTDGALGGRGSERGRHDGAKSHPRAHSEKSKNDRAQKGALTLDVTEGVSIIWSFILPSGGGVWQKAGGKDFAAPQGGSLNKTFTGNADEKREKKKVRDRRGQGN